MANTIDNKIVQMEFDNAKFESNVQTSMNTIDKLKQGLNFDESSKSANALTSAVGSISEKFSALGIIATTALVNITNSAINAGKQLLQSLTIAPVAEGWGEYELKLNTIQAIMNATGQTAETVGQKIVTLDDYADKTVYTTRDMFENLSTFTNAGVALDTATMSMIGIANATALAGQGTQAATIAYRNFSDGIANGFMSLMDFRSLSRVSKIATQEFRQEMIEAGVAAGTLTRGIDGVTKVTSTGAVVNRNFEDTLKDQWLTAEALNIALNKYADESTDLGKRAYAAAKDIRTFTQLLDTTKAAIGTGWSQTFEILFGGLEQSKKLWTSVADVVTGFVENTTEARNAMLTFWAENEGRDTLINAIGSAFDNMARLIKPIKDAFRQIFPPMTGQDLVNLTKRFAELVEKFKIGEETSEKLRRTFAGLFAVVDIIGEGFKFLARAAGELFSIFAGDAVGGLLDATANLGDFLVRLRDVIKGGDIFNIALERIRAFLQNISIGLKDAIERIKTAFGMFRTVKTDGAEDLANRTETALRPFSVITKLFGAAFEALVKVLEWAAPIVLNLGEAVAKGLGKVSEIVSRSIQNMDFSEILDLINAGLFGGILFAIRNFIKSLTGITGEAGGFLSSITGILDGVRGSLEAFQSNLKAKTLLTIASAVGILAAALFTLALIDDTKLAGALASISALFVELSVAMVVLQKSLAKVSISRLGTQLIAFAAAILILSIAMGKLAALDWEGVGKGTAAIAALTGIMGVFVKTVNRDSGAMMKGAVNLIAFSAAILIMSESVEKLSALSWEELAKGLSGLTVIIAEVIAMSRLMGDQKRMVSIGVGMIAVGAAMLIFAEAIERMGQLSWTEIGKGLTTMAGALAAITVSMNLLPKNMMSKATGLIGVGAALLLIGDAVISMSSLSWDEVGRGLAVLAGALTAITVAMNLMPKNMMSRSVGLIGVATALTILIKPLEQMAAMSWEEAARALVVLAGSMGILAGALQLMQKGVAGAAALLIISPALIALGAALKIMGSMQWDEIAKGLVALAGALAVIGGATFLLQGLVPAMIGLGAAVALLGVGILAVGAGVLAFSTALAALSVSATSAAAAVVIIGTAFLSLIPILFEKIGEGIVSLANVIINGAPLITEAFLVLLESGLKAITESAPMIADAFLGLVLSLLQSLNRFAGPIVDEIFNFIIMVINKLAERIPELIRATFNLFGAFFQGVVDALGEIDTDSLLKGIAGIGLMSGILVALSAITSFIPGAMLGVLGMAGVIAEMAILLAAIGALNQIPGLNWLIGEGGKLLESIGTAIGSFVGGIIGGVIGGISSSFPKIATNLSAFMTNLKPFLDGAKNVTAETMAGVQSLANVILILTAANVLDGLTSWFTGGTSLADFGSELAKFGPFFNQYYQSVKGIDGSVVQASANAALTMAEFAAKLPNSGGMASWFAGENSLSIFADELVLFGPKLKAYADSVKGLDASVVQASATAALALAEMAAKLPNQGGIVSWFTGDNSLTVFADELVAFGPVIKQYADSVRGLDPAVVKASADAALSLSAMAKSLPNQGGMVSWFTGDNTLSVFGAELAKFGPYLKLYSNSVSGMDASVVTNSANAAKALSELANNLPNSGGIISWFTGDNDIGAFGEKLVIFGNAFASYYQSVSGINTATLSGVVIEFKKLVDLASGVSSIDTSGMSRFSSDLKNLGNSGIDQFILAFTDANSRVAEASENLLSAVIKGFKSKSSEAVRVITDLMTSVVDKIKGKYNDFQAQGREIIVKLIAGIRSQETNARNTITSLMSGLLEIIKSRFGDFESYGKSIMQYFASGISQGSSNVVSFVQSIVSSAAEVPSGYYQSFYDSGRYLVEGFANGINANRYLAEARAREMAKSAADAAKNQLAIQSPSKVGYSIGNYFGEGFVNALTDYISIAYESSSLMAEGAREGLASAIHKITDLLNNEIDTHPVIRPVLDLSNLKANEGLFNGFIGVSSSITKLQQANASNNHSIIKSGEIKEQPSSVVNFNQINNSPKALSRYEIYRQTQNGLRTVGRLVNP